MILISLFCSCAYKQNTADILVYNGNILLHGDATSQVKALVIKDGVVLDHGPKEEMRNLYRYEKEINLMGKTVFPLIYKLDIQNQKEAVRGFNTLNFKDTIIMAIKDTLKYTKVGDVNVYYTSHYTSRYPFDQAFIADSIVSTPPNKPILVHLKGKTLSNENDVWTFNQEINLYEPSFWEEGVNFLPKSVKSSVWGLDKGQEANFFILNRNPLNCSKEEPVEVHEIYNKGKSIYNFLYE